MDQLMSLLDEVFDRSFPGSRHPIAPVLPNSPRMGGFVVWDGFDELSQRERQKAVWQAIRDNLDSQDQQRITAILTLTPSEEQAMLENE